MVVVKGVMVVVVMEAAAVWDGDHHQGGRGQCHERDHHHIVFVGHGREVFCGLRGKTGRGWVRVGEVDDGDPRQSQCRGWGWDRLGLLFV